MVTRRGFIRAGLAAGLSGPILSACSGVASSGGGGKDGFQVAWWGGSDRAKRTQQVIKLFEKKHGMKLSESFSDFDSYFQKLNTEAAGGGLPDVLQLGGGYVPQYMHKGQLLDLTTFAEKRIDVKDFDAGQLAQGRVNGKLYAVSIGGNMPAVIYNRTMIEKAGMQPPPDDISWDAFADYLGRLAKKLPAGSYPVDHQGGATFTVWIRQRLAEPYTDDGKIAWTESDVREYFQYWDDLRKAGSNIPGEMVAAEIQNGAADASPIVQGKAVFSFQWSNFLGQYQILTKDKLAMMRTPTGGKQAGDFVQASQFFSISAKSKAAEAAADFIQFFIHDQAALKILGVERGVPASAKARDLVEPTLQPYDALQVRFLTDNNAKTRPKTQLDPANSAAVGDAMTRAEQSISLAHTSVASAAAKFMSDAEKALES
jgi:pectin-derived oligosaccharide transport system substrate-binding protein